MRGCRTHALPRASERASPARPHTLRAGEAVTRTLDRTSRADHTTPRAEQHGPREGEETACTGAECVRRLPRTPCARGTKRPLHPNARPSTAHAPRASSYGRPAIRHERHSGAHADPAHRTMPASRTHAGRTVRHACPPHPTPPLHNATPRSACAPAGHSPSAAPSANERPPHPARPRHLTATAFLQSLLHRCRPPARGRPRCAHPWRPQQTACAASATARGRNSMTRPSGEPEPFSSSNHFSHLAGLRRVIRCPPA